jgi:CHAT domain-containing protein
VAHLNRKQVGTGGQNVNLPPNPPTPQHPDATNNLATALLYAGTAAVISALWPLDNAVRRRLAGTFYD